MTRLIALCLTLTLAFSPWSAAVQDDPADPELLEGIRQAQTGDFEDAVITLDGVVRRLSAERGRPRDLARAYLYLSIAYLGLAEEEKAKARFLEAWRADDGIELSPSEFPPRILEFFEQARQEAIDSGVLSPGEPATVSSPEPEPARRTEPARVPEPEPVKEKGGSKKLLLLLGVGAAAGVGVAVAAGGGGSDEPSGPVTRTFESADVPRRILDNSTVTSSLNVSGMNGTISNLSVSVNISHTFQGDLTVRLRHPSGTAATLHDRTGGSTDNIVMTYRPGDFTGMTANGTWTLEVQDSATLDQGQLNSWSLTMTVS